MTIYDPVHCTSATSAINRAKRGKLVSLSGLGAVAVWILEPFSAATFKAKLAEKMDLSYSNAYTKRV